MNIESLPKKISIFPLSNVIFFPKTILPLNIFEKRYLEMVNDSIKKDRYFGIVQPKYDLKKTKSKAIDSSEVSLKPNLFSIGCLGKIINFNETDDGRFIINLSGIIRFKIEKEVENEKLYREAIVNYKNFEQDLIEKSQDIKKEKRKNILNKIKILLKKRGYKINWKELEVLDFAQFIDTLSMISPLSLEEKQSLIETKDLSERIKILERIADLYLADNFEVKTIQ